MDKKRKVYAPFSLTSEAGVAQTPVEGYIDVNQVIYPTVNTGTVNENGTWTGVKSNDGNFIGLSKALAIPNTGEALFPDSNNHPSINMEGFTDLQFAIKPTRAGTYTLSSVVGPDTIRFANLEPVTSGEAILTVHNPASDNIGTALSDSISLVANAWNIITIYDGRVKDQQNLQIKVVNAAGGNSDIEFAFRRLV
jgi:hypothetical protein